MSGFSKEQLQQWVDSVMEQLPLFTPAEIVFVTDSPGAPFPGVVVGSSFVPENGKVYLVVPHGGNIVVNLPPAATTPIGFCFEVLNVGGTLSGFVTEIRRQVQSPSTTTPVIFLGAEYFFNSGINDPVLLDQSGQHVRLVFVGGWTPVPGIEISIWKVTRLDNKLSDTRMVHLATTEPLPPYTVEGDDGPDRILTAVSGTLTVDGQALSGVANLSVLVKDEEDGDEDNNGIYMPVEGEWNPWKLRRRNDFSEYSQLDRGAAFQVLLGDYNRGRQFYYTHKDGLYIPDVKGGLRATPVKTDEYTLKYNELVPYTPASFTGTKRLTFPSGPRYGPKYGDRVGIKNITSSAASINLYSAGYRIQVDGVIYAISTDIPVAKANFGRVWEYLPVPGGDTWMEVPYFEGGGLSDAVQDDTLSAMDGAWHTITTYVSPSTTDKAVHARIVVLARNAGGGGGTLNHVAKFVIEGTFAWQASIPNIKDLNFISIYRDDPNWDVRVIAPPGPREFYIQILGVAGQNLQWRCQLEVSEHG